MEFKQHIDEIKKYLENLKSVKGNTPNYYDSALENILIILSIQNETNHNLVVDYINHYTNWKHELYRD